MKQRRLWLLLCGSLLAISVLSLVVSSDRQFFWIPITLNATAFLLWYGTGKWYA